jgi:hypothetical protein
MYGPRLRSHVRPQTPVTYEWDNCRANTPTDRQEFVPMCLRSTDRPIDELYVQPLSPPDARTVLLPESDNCRAYTPAIQRPIDRSSSECSTYYHYLMRAPHCHQNWHLAALPAAAYLGTTILYFHNLSAAYLGITILCFHNLLTAYSGITILWFYFIIDWFYFILLEYMDKSYMVTCLGTAVLLTKKELPVSEYKDRSYIVTRRRRVVDMSLSCCCRVSD